MGHELLTCNTNSKRRLGVCVFWEGEEGLNQGLIHIMGWAGNVENPSCLSECEETEAVINHGDIWPGQGFLSREVRLAKQDRHYEK